MKQKIVFVVGLLLIILAGIWAAYTYPKSDSGVVSNADDAEVRRVVTEFGIKLQAVSLLASTENRKAAMDAAYSQYVAPELLAKWYPAGADVFGRNTSSPWPERIEIVEVKPVAGNFLVEGNVIEVTSKEAGTGKSAAAVYPVTLALEKREGNWTIVKAEKGAYSELPQQRTIVGYWECLPPKDRNGPHTLECAFGIAMDQSDGHYAVDTRLMSTYPVDYPVGTKVRITGVVTPVESLSSIQKYDIDGVISATTIQKI